MRSHLLLLVQTLLALLSPRLSQGNTVYLFRHCVRNVDTSGVQEYAKDPFPAWGVAKDMCLPRGVRIFQGIGATLKGSFASPPLIVADYKQRNVDSANGLATGLGVPTSAVQINADPFNHDQCKHGPSSKDKDKLISARFKSIPPPQNFSSMVKGLDTVLEGIHRVADEKTKVDGDKLKGAADITASIADAFLMQYGGGMEVGWGRVDPNQMYDLLKAHVYDWTITHRSLPVEVPKSSPMMSSILQALDASSKHSSTIFVGHDTDINGVGTLLDVGWAAPPYPDNTTAPSVALRFHSTATSVAVDFVYVTFDSEAAPLRSTPLLNLTVPDFCARAVKHVDWGCFKGMSRGLCKQTGSRTSSARIEVV